ncbi:uncharacterized protein [Palaemon carinicauda]|uniref:uncharacterized protein n=1 Tax=Palaemon carinicauda TaxID=392227 RepID=UPI0035B60259
MAQYRITPMFNCRTLLLIFCVILKPALAKHECFADLNGPKDDPNNIYKCNDNEKCCQDGGKPSCCREKDKSVATMEQIQLWGTLAVLILILAIVVWYCRHDGDCCGNKKGQEDKKCCGCCGGSTDDDHEIQEVVGGDDGSDDDEDDTPGPAVYKLPDKKTHPPPSKDQIPEQYRDMDFSATS